MIRFIFGCAFILSLSFLAIPVYYGISSQKNVVTTTADATNNDSLSFEEIYALASDVATPSAEALNDIATAAGTGSGDTFSSGFQNADNPALADTPVAISSITEPETAIIGQENTN